MRTRRWRVVPLLAVLMFGAVSRIAAGDTNNDGFVTILLPLAISDTIPGAYGTTWRQETWLGNANPGGAFIQYPEMCGVISMCELQYPAGYLAPVLEPFWIHPERGVLLHVDANQAPLLTFSARISEVTRHAQPQGFELPVVREGDFLSGASYFLGVPYNSDVRVTLRLYDPWRVSGTAFKVEVVGQQGVVGQTTLTTTFSDAPAAELIVPGFAMVADLNQSLAIPSSVDHYSIRVTPLKSSTEYWAMVSVTDNDTQQVLIITPK